MIFHYLREIKPHLPLLAFLGFAFWLALIVAVDMAAGSFWGEGSDPVIPPPPLEAGPSAPTGPQPPDAVRVAPTDEETPVAPPASQDCLDIEGTVICLE